MRFSSYFFSFLSTDVPSSHYTKCALLVVTDKILPTLLPLAEISNLVKTLLAKSLKGKIVE